MFDKIGQKIKNAVIIMCAVGICISVVIGLYVMFANDLSFKSFLMGLLAAGIGILVSWLSGFLLYGYGELVDNSQKILTAVKENAVNAAMAVPTRNTDTSSEGTTRYVETIECPKCGLVQKRGRAFCSSCNEAFFKKVIRPWEREEVLKSTENKADNGIKCPNCGKMLKQGQIFCIECGTKLHE